MYLYNISIIIDRSESTVFLPWLQEYLKSSRSLSVNFLKMHNAQHEGETYCLHLNAQNQEEIEEFKTDYIIPIQRQILKNHNEKIFIFDSLMEYLPLS